MRLRILLPVLVLAAVPAWALLAPAPTEGTVRRSSDSSCITCHAKEARAAANDVHAGCTDCHGGDASKADKAASHAAMRPVTRAAVPEGCARCHADARLMNPTGLPTDQLAHYRNSRHGEAHAKGRVDAAVCTDCHNAHGIRRVRDAASPVHFSKLPYTCARCHSDEELMTRHGLPATAPALYLGSVHGKLLSSGDRAAPTCATCHGNHGAVPPGFAEVGHVCGKCHVRQLEAFDASPHAFYAKDGSFKGCVACHSNHAIVRDGETILGRCTPCHENGDAEVKKARELLAAARAPREAFDRTATRLGAAARAGANVDDEQALLETAKTAMLQIPADFHALDAKRIAAHAGETRAALDAVESRLDEKERSERNRRLILVPVWIFLAAMAALFWAKRRRIERKEALHAG